MVKSDRSRRILKAALRSTPATNDVACNDKQPQLATSRQDNIISQCVFAPIASFAPIEPHATNIEFDAQPSTSGIQHRLPDRQHVEADNADNEQYSDFSDDDSVADPNYVPDIDDRIVSQLLDSDEFNQNVLEMNEASMHCFDEFAIEEEIQVGVAANDSPVNAQNVHQALSAESENSDNNKSSDATETSSVPQQSMTNNLDLPAITNQIFIAQYPGPIFVTNNLNNTNTFHNKNKLKHPIVANSCDGKCRRQCSSFAEQDRLKIWDEYWNNKFEVRRGFLNKCVQFSEVKRRKVNKDNTPNSTFKNESRHYYLPTKDTKELIPVRKSFFLGTLGFRTDGVITELSKAVKNGLLYASLTVERRGGKRKYINRDCLQEHILHYNPAVSHYRRYNAPFTKYLPRELTVREMHLYFKKKHPEIQCSEETYRKEIKVMKISFNMPRGDKCDECLAYELKKKEMQDESLLSEDERGAQAAHKTKSDQALESYKNDATIENTKHVKYFSMDLQKVIMLPLMPQIKEAVFISRLITFNLTFAPINKKSPDPATCILWHEAQASRQASNIVNAIFAFIKQERDCQHFHIWADNCTAQNKNWTLYTALATIVNTETTVETITLSYLTKGHTHMTADSVHGNIENKMRKKGDVLDYEDFKDVVNSSRKNIRVIEPTSVKKWPRKKRAPKKSDDEDLMKSFLLNPVVRVKFVAGSKNLLYKTSFNEPFAELDFLPKTYKVTELPKEITEPRGIPAKKKDTIVAKLEPLMPETRRDFWCQLPVNDQSVDLQTGGELLPDD